MKTLEDTFQTQLGIGSSHQDYADVFSAVEFKTEDLCTLPNTLNGNSFDARVQLTIEMPDGSEWECEKTIKLKMKMKKK